MEIPNDILFGDTGAYRNFNHLVPPSSEPKRIYAFSGIVDPSKQYFVERLLASGAVMTFVVNLLNSLYFVLDLIIEYNNNPRSPVDIYTKMFGEGGIGFFTSKNFVATEQATITSTVLAPGQTNQWKSVMILTKLYKSPIIIGSLSDLKELEKI